MTDPKPQSKPMWQNKTEHRALYYLGRYHASTHQFEAMLMRHYYRQKIKPCKFNDYKKFVHALIIKLERLGYLNNKTYLESKIRQFYEKGKSKYYIQTALKQKGFKEKEVEEALREYAEQNEETSAQLELNAAKQFIQKKSLGPYNKKTQSSEQSKKELAKFLRAGFSYDLWKELCNSY